MGKSQSKSKTPTKAAGRKNRHRPPSTVPDSPYINPDEETANASFDEPARVRMLTTVTKTRASVGPPRRPPTRKARQASLTSHTNEIKAKEEEIKNAPTEETPPLKQKLPGKESPKIRVTSPDKIHINLANDSFEGKRPQTPSPLASPKSPTSVGLASASPRLPRLTLKIDEWGPSPGSTRRELFAKKGQSLSVPNDTMIARAKSMYSPLAAEEEESRERSGSVPLNASFPGRLPRFAIDAASVEKMVAEKKKKKRKAGVGSGVQKEKKRRRSSLESGLLSHAETGHSRRKSNPEKGDDDVFGASVTFYTPQVRRSGKKEKSAMLGRPQVKVESRD